MSKGAIGFGSASIVLVFAVLCLTIFSLFSFTVAQNQSAIADAKYNLIVGYYKADAAAEQILAEILEANNIPASVRDIEINIEHDVDTDLGSTVVNFSYPLYYSDSMVLFVRVAIFEDSYSLLSWRMVNTADWEKDDGLNIHLGFD